jgi:hypothetical protein
MNDEIKSKILHLVARKNAEAGYEKYSYHRELDYYLLISETGTGVQFDTDKQMLDWLTA